MTEGCFYCTGRKPRGAYQLCKTGSTNADEHRVGLGRCHTHPLLQLPKFAPPHRASFPGKAPQTQAILCHSNSDPITHRSSPRGKQQPGDQHRRWGKPLPCEQAPGAISPTTPLSAGSACSLSQPLYTRSCVSSESIYCIKESRSFLSGMKSTPYCSSLCTGTKASSGRQAPIEEDAYY